MGVIFASCTLTVNVQVTYLEKASGHATEDEVVEEFGAPIEKHEERVDYWLTFDSDKILKSWARKECGE